MDLYLALTLAIVGLVSWIFGVMKPHRRTWVKAMVLPAAVVLLFYVGMVVPEIRPELYSGRIQLGWPQLIAIIGGVWALLAKPKDSNDKTTNTGNGAHA